MPFSYIIRDFLSLLIDVIRCRVIKRTEKRLKKSKRLRKRQIRIKSISSHQNDTTKMSTDNPTGAIIIIYHCRTVARSE